MTPGSRQSRLRNTFMTILLLALSGCTTIPPEQRTEYDPLESVNRPVNEFNLGLDKMTTRPLARGYAAVVPGPARKGIANFFANLLTPRSSLNHFLQGKPKQGFSELGRLVINSTVGIGGLFDVATSAGLEEQREDFGQTAAVWGMPAGPYVVLPFLGPRTLRDALFSPINKIAEPLVHYDNTSVRDKLLVLELIAIRERFLSADKLLQDSKDPYVTLRESYLQNREYQVFDGEPPEDDDFFDEFLDEELPDE